MIKLVIPGALPGLNEYIAAERQHRQKAAAMKKQYEHAIILLIKTQLRGVQFSGPVRMTYTWHEKDRRRDKDNVSSMGRKIIQDAMVKAGVLSNDGWAEIDSFQDNFSVDKRNPRIEITIEEVKHGQETPKSRVRNEVHR
ncbi:MAG: RusA family crossover junction endodeoxyribonuclease [Clostridia bacterium]|nr:RusA family crossover junction endodeoxyribonuclease [Clostridia bacterium]